MGYNSTVVILNDCIHDIENDPDFGKKLGRSIAKCFMKREPVNISSGSSCNAATVIESHHADHMVVVEVGGNTGRVIDEHTVFDEGYHACFACGHVHEGVDNKHCKTCGDVAQEHRTYREALKQARIMLENGDDAKSVIAIVQEALVVGPLGERLDCGLADEAMKEKESS